MPSPHRFTVEEYHQMAMAGVLAPDSRTELIEGEVVEMAPIGSRHASVVKRLNRFFSTGVGGRAVVGVQDPVQLWPYSEPQPDLALLVPRHDDYAIGHPGAGDVLLVVEVADSSGPFDRRHKLPLYARHGVPEVWLVDIPGRAVEMYRAPGAEGYGTVVSVGEGGTVAPLAFPDLVLEVSLLLPSQ